MTTKITLCAEGRRYLEMKSMTGRRAKSIVPGAGMEILPGERIEAREGLM